MARLTAEERAQLKALQDRAKAEEAEENELVIQAKNSRGIEVTYRGARARAFLQKHGFEDPDPETDGGEDEEPDEEEDGEEPDPDPAGGDGYFRRRKK